MFMRYFGFHVVLLATLAWTGCSPQDGGLQRAAVEGTVTVDGVPVEMGAITFVPTNGTSGPATGGKITDGKYKIQLSDGPVVGQYLVQIMGRRGTGKFKVEELEGETVKTEIIEEMIPKKYRTSSELRSTIQTGTNVLDFDLSSDG
ncbi:hypothetical protein AB1K70_11705 [Bremerella sp. JC770]|uniref:hypothetical protein n=1 Tax=Bremerella sp. JC770 TaxID=3232137 RepID=UPI00345A9969